MCKNRLNDRTLLYAIRDQLALSMIDFADYLSNDYPLIDCDSVKKNYLYATTDNYKLDEIITKYILNLMIENDSLNESVNKDDMYDTIYNNIDIFVEIMNKDDDTYIIELTSKS